jgi:uncharacterized protein
MEQGVLVNGLELQDIANSLSNRVWGLTVLPTEKCNFRFKYCYESFTLGRMGRTTIEAIKRLMRHRIQDPELKQFHLNWFGGEPLLAVDVILEISRYAKELCEEHGCAFGCGIITNASLLTQNVLLELLNAGVTKFVTAIDGPEKVHDKTRVDVRGGGTHEVVRRNILCMKSLDADFSLVVRLQVCQDNIDAIYESVDDIAGLLWGDRRIHLTIVPIGRLGGSNDDKETFPEPVDRIRGKNILEDLHALFQKRLQMIVTANERICHAARMNALTIRPNGRIVQCVGCLDDPRNDIGRIREDGTLELQHDKLAFWSRGYSKIDFDLLTCPQFKCPSVSSV